MLRRSLCLILTFTFSLSFSAQVVINEMMQSNIDCLMDDKNDFPDSWIELYNNSEHDIELHNFRLGISKNLNEIWAIPDTIIKSRGFLLIYCDKEKDASYKYHAPFRLDSGNNTCIYLYEGTKCIDSVEGLKRQPAPNIAYGRKSDGEEKWGYEFTPTPNSSNQGGICDINHILEDPIFSENGRVIVDENTINLVLSIPEHSPDGTTIHFTLDGSEPTKNSNVYRNPIIISSTEIVRAKLICEGWLSPRSITQSFIFHPREVTIPIISICSDCIYFDDPKIGIYVTGEYMEGKPNYNFNWRRPINIEIFENAEEKSVINQLCETRISGVSTRNRDLKSMVIYAHKRFGNKIFDYEFFPDQKENSANFKSLVLRNAGNDFSGLYLRDALVQNVMGRNSDIDWQAWAPAVLYINGVYKGLINIRERSNEDNIYSNYGGLETIDLLENGEVKEGDNVSYNQLTNYIENANCSYEKYSELIDLDEFSNVMLMNLFFCNIDFPGNNNVMWKQKNGGKWRWIAKDEDLTIGLWGEPADYKILNWLYDPDFDISRNWGANKKESTLLFRNLMAIDVFKDFFISRSCVYMGDFLNEKGIMKVWEPMRSTIRQELIAHKSYYKPWLKKTENGVENEIDSLQELAHDWIKKRTDAFYHHLGDFYQLGNPVTCSVNNGIEEQFLFPLKINNIILNNLTFEGKFFPGQHVIIEPDDHFLKQVAGWRIWQIESGEEKVIQEDGCVCEFDMPLCDKLLIQAIRKDEPDCIINEKKPSWYRVGDYIYVRDIPANSRLLLYGLNGTLLKEYNHANNVTIYAPLSELYVLIVDGCAVKIF